MKLIMMGPPMSGKGTQTERLSKKFGIEMISTGNILRKQIAEGTELGKKAQEYMDKGNLVPDRLIIELIADRFDGLGDNLNFVLDGFPRTLSQAGALYDYLGSKGTKIDHVIRLVVDRNVLMSRLTGRMTCENCGATYSLTEDRPKRFGICDNCGEPLTKRKDDKVETLSNRLNIYTEMTRPLIAYYREKGVLVDIDGNQSPDKVFEDIVQAVEGRQ